VGATAGIATLVVVGVVPTWRLHLRLRPALRFPPGVARRAGGLALVGVAELVVVDLASVVAITQANGRGPTGAIVIYNYAYQVFGSVSAVLALSVVVSAFPVLSARDGAAFSRTCAGSTRAVLLLSWLGTAVMAAIAVPAAHVLARTGDQVPQLIEAFALFAPGIAGAAVISNLSRVMFAVGRLKVAAAGLAGSWLLVMAAEAALVFVVPSRLVVAALALGTTIGQTAVAIPMVMATRRICGRDSIAGVARANLSGLAAGAVGAAIGVGVCLALPVSGKLMALGVAVVAACGAVVAFGAVAYILDRRDLKVIAVRIRRLLR
jgi:putative peptidoglycan lipid II flippase